MRAMRFPTWDDKKTLLEPKVVYEMENLSQDDNALDHFIGENIVVHGVGP